MNSIGFIEVIGFYCPHCKLKTAGIIENGKRMCPICRRELWHCSLCHHYTFGLKNNPDRCDNCKIGTKKIPDS